MAWLCIDAGTSVIKSVVLSADGRELALARASVAVLHPQDGFCEQEMEEVWAAVLRTAKDAVAQAGALVEGIAITAQGDGVWLVDAHGAPVHRAVLWNDGRAAEIVDGWREEGVLAEAAEISGCTSYPGLPNSIWRWFAANQPEVLAAATASLTCNGWIFLRMTGKVVADMSDASNPFCDGVRKEYSKDLLKSYGVDAMERLLPRLKNSAEPMAALLPEIMTALGLTGSVPVVMAPYDIVSTAHGTGCIAAGQGCVILGTTICAEVVSDQFEMKGSGTTIALGDELFLHAMPTLTGCEALSWAVSLLRLDTIEELEELAIQAPAGSDGLIFLPYLSLAGERSPFLEPHARGSWSMLSLSHSSAHMSRSVYEGLSYVVRDCLHAAGIASGTEVRVCGGGSRSRFWCQMIADVTGHAVLRPRAEELGARGALLHGRVRVGEVPNLQAAFDSVPIDEDRFVPCSELKKSYDVGFARFIATRNALQGQWQKQWAGGNQ